MLGTVGIPTILLAILIALPFIDLRRERRLSRRPVAIVAAILVVLSMGMLTYKGATAKEALGSELGQAVPTWAESAGLRGQRRTPSRGAEIFAAGRLRQVPHVPRRGLVQPRRARPVRHRREQPRRRVLRPLRRQPGAVREHRDAAVRGPRRGEPREARRLPRRLQGPEGVGPRAMHVFLGDHRRVGRAVRRSAAARARRRRLRGRRCRVREPGIEVIATELYGDATAAARRGAASGSPAARRT